MRFVQRMAASIALAIPAVAVAAGPIAVYRDPGCGCCEKWAGQVRAQFATKVEISDASDRSALHRRYGLPTDLVSCHSAVVDGLIFEGHVPIADMKRLLASRPRGIAGLAVAGMPMGSPGMEMPGMKSQPYDVIAFGPSGRRVFAHHG